MPRRAYNSAWVGGCPKGLQGAPKGLQFSLAMAARRRSKANLAKHLRLCDDVVTPPCGFEVSFMPVRTYRNQGTCERNPLGMVFPLGGSQLEPPWFRPQDLTPLSSCASGCPMVSTTTMAVIPSGVSDPVGLSSGGLKF